jgi:hypothetical protein
VELQNHRQFVNYVKIKQEPDVRTHIRSEPLSKKRRVEAKKTKMAKMAKSLAFLPFLPFLSFLLPSCLSLCGLTLKYYLTSAQEQ